jgi:hypothetical protein
MMPYRLADTYPNTNQIVVTNLLKQIHEYLLHILNVTYSTAATDSFGYKHCDQSPCYSHSKHIYDINRSNPPARYLYSAVLMGLVWSNDPESYACNSFATAGQVKGNDPDMKVYPGPLGRTLGRETNNLISVKTD